jgi:hypothetical protein
LILLSGYRVSFVKGWGKIIGISSSPWHSTDDLFPGDIKIKLFAKKLDRLDEIS